MGRIILANTSKHFTAVISLDVQGAFGAIRSNKLLRKRKKLKGPIQLLSFARIWPTKIKLRTKTNTVEGAFLGEGFASQTGAPEGGVASTAFWNAFISAMPDDVKVLLMSLGVGTQLLILSFADDMTILLWNRNIDDL